MIDEAKLRAKLKEYTDHADTLVSLCGVAGGYIEAARAEVARDLLAWLAVQPAVLSPDRIPPAIRAGLARYAECGVRTGACLQAILAGDLFGAFARADPETRDAMPAIVAYIHGRLPAACHGSEAIVERWIARPRS